MTLPPTKLFFAAPSDCLSLEAQARNLGIRQAIGGRQYQLTIGWTQWHHFCFSEQVWPWPALLIAVE